ncbi:MAG TPA: hypothetical protein VGP07_07695 [Polyangia bacterium]|jgi:hypothetical protein
MGKVVASRRAVWLIGVLGGLALGGCSLHQAGVTPPDNRIFFPSGGIIDPDGQWLYVVNSNSDLRYNAGTIVAVDLTAVRNDDPRQNPAGTAWPVCPTDPRYVPPADQAAAAPLCCWDLLDSSILNCDEQVLINREWTVQIGSFAGTPVIQTFPDDLTTDPPTLKNRRMYVPVRGDTSVTFMNLARGVPADGTKFRCTGPRRDANEPADGLNAPSVQNRFAICEDLWRVTRKDDPNVYSKFHVIPDDQVMYLPDEPYALALDADDDLLYVGHLRGYVSVIDLGIGELNGPQVPNLVDRNSGVLPADASGSVGVTSLTIHPTTSTCGKEIYATSRFRPLASSFLVYGVAGARCGRNADAASSPGGEGLVVVPTGSTLSTGVAGSDTRGIQFVNSKYLPPGSILPPSSQNQNSSPDRAFLIQRNPPTLVGVDLSTQLPLSTMEICQGPTNLQQPTDSQGNPLFGVPMLFITCFDSGELYVVDPSIPQIRSVIPVGREPINTVFDATDPTRAYVMTFGGNNISVVDLDPFSPTYERVIERIGFPSATPRDVGP